MARIAPHTHTLRNGTTITVRTAAPADAAQTLALYRAVVQEGQYTLIEPDEFRRTEEVERDIIAEDAANPGAVYIVAEADGAIVATARAEAGSLRRTAHAADVSAVWTDVRWRGHGVGNAVLHALIAWAREHPQIEKLGLFVFSTSTSAIALYKKHGFVKEGLGVRDMKQRNGEYIDTVIMALFVTP